MPNNWKRSPEVVLHNLCVNYTIVHMLIKPEHVRRPDGGVCGGRDAKAFRLPVNVRYLHNR